MKRSFVLITTMMLVATCLPLSAADLIDRPKEGRQYETLVFRFEENLPFENPFDLRTNQVELHILQPDFTRKVLSFFYDGVTADSVQRWEARFTPKQAGLHRFSVHIAGEVRERFAISMDANEESHQGGLQLSERLGVFEYESGEPWRGIGINVCWADDYEYYFKKMQAVGMNVTRLWMCPWHLSFEWKETGLGRYNLETASRLDSILALAQQYDIFVLLALDYHGIARKGMGYFKENRWLDNPYNKINGGPCDTGAELFTNPVAKEYFKKKYKYLVSRFGHHRRLATWEFYNEADLMAGEAIPVNRWHIEMAEFVQSIDVHDRLVSSSSTRSYPEKLIDAFKSPAMDYIMYHSYNELNLAPYVTNLHEMSNEYYQKPMVIGEIGIEFRGADRTYKLDPEGIGPHNAIWAGWFSETPMIPLSWWWDNYIDPYDLWGLFGRLSRFAEKMTFDAARLEFKTLDVGHLQVTPEEQAPCMVRAIYSGSDCALWFTNQQYQWSVISEGDTLTSIRPFTQPVPDLVPGRYRVQWYDPQTGEFFHKPTEAEVKPDGVLTLTVPSFTKDLACLITRE